MSPFADQTNCEENIEDQEEENNQQIQLNSFKPKEKIEFKEKFDYSPITKRSKYQKNITSRKTPEPRTLLQYKNSMERLKEISESIPKRKVISRTRNKSIQKSITFETF